MSTNAQFHFQKEDEKCIKNAERKVLVKTRMARRKLCDKKKSKGEFSKTTYFPGAFGLSKEPEVNLKGVKEPKKPKLKFKECKPQENLSNGDLDETDDYIPLIKLAGVTITFVNDEDVEKITSIF